jgi:hypothetical protein
MVSGWVWGRHDYGVGWDFCLLTMYSVTRIWDLGASLNGGVRSPGFSSTPAPFFFSPRCGFPQAATGRVRRIRKGHKGLKGHQGRIGFSMVLPVPGPGGE